MLRILSWGVAAFTASLFVDQGHFHSLDPAFAMTDCKKTTGNQATEARNRQVPEKAHLWYYLTMKNRKSDTPIITPHRRMMLMLEASNHILRLIDDPPVNEPRGDVQGVTEAVALQIIDLVLRDFRKA